MKKKLFKMLLVTILVFVATMPMMGCRSRQLGEVVAISAGDRHSLALDAYGNVWAWGRKIDSLSPVQVTNGTHFVQIGAGLGYSVALDESGNIWAWGFHVLLETGATQRVENPTQITQEINFIYINVGSSYSLAIDSDGNIWAWGIPFPGGVKNFIPVQVTNDRRFVSIVAGFFNLAIDDGGNIWQWQRTTLWGEQHITREPVQITNDIELVSISGGDSYNWALDINGNLWAWWPFNRLDQDNPMVTNNFMPTRIFYEQKFSQISNSNHVLAIDMQKNIWAWGMNVVGQVGSGTITNFIDAPTKIKEGQFVNVSAAGNHSLAMCDKGRLFSWGGNFSGQLGDGTTICRNLPVQINRV
ncbi:MAG: hypothetical protein FWE22_06465 [Firmicutes bacterium]|nr:hypothetical protein [Bacillota bacterium]